MLYTDVLLVPGCGLCDYRTGEALAGGDLFRNHMRPKKPVMRMNGVPHKTMPEQELPNAFYGGYLFSHYGHFLLESLARLGELSSYANVPVLWHNLHGRSKDLKPWQQQIFSLLALDKFQNLIVQQPLLIRKLEVCVPGYRIRDIFESDHRDFLSVVDVEKRGGKIWVSRSHTPDLAGWINELEVESILQQHGWTVVRPEHLDIVDQVKLLASCEVLAGIAGSAFHSLMLARQVHCRVVLFSRGMTKVVNQNFETIARAKGFQQSILYPEQMPVPGPSKEDAPKFYVNANDIFKALGVSASFEYHALCKRLISNMSHHSIAKNEGENV
jgi:Glycosyltransferase 61